MADQPLAVRAPSGGSRVFGEEGLTVGLFVPADKGAQSVQAALDGALEAVAAAPVRGKRIESGLHGENNSSRADELCPFLPAPTVLPRPYPRC